jgi:hypothetical protein
MTDEIDVMKKAIMYYDRAILLKRMNENLYDHLIGSIIWLLRYSDKNGIILPKKEELYDMVTKCETFFQEIAASPSPPESQQPSKVSDDRIQHDKNNSSDEEEYRAIFK